MRRLRLRDEGGFTLIEMIMVLAILGIVLGGVTTVFIGGSRAELQVNNRFQAQEASRLAMAAIRKDVHGACAANVDTATHKILTLSIPNSSAALTKEACGTSDATLTKVIWVVCTSPTVSTKFAVYRATATTCPSTGKLVADNLITPGTNPVTGVAGFFQTAASTTVSIPYGEWQTVDVDMRVSLKQGTSGQPFDLQERLALPNGVWVATSGLSCSSAQMCLSGPCWPTSGTCFVPAIA